MRVLVTGGSGFIGANLIRYLLKKHSDYRVINFDVQSGTGQGGRLSFLENHPGYTFVKGDITSESDVQDVFESYRPDFVVHLASKGYIDRSINNPSVFLKTNVIGTQLVLMNARDAKISKMLHISTSKVYGTTAMIEEKYCKENFLYHIIDEESVLLPSDPYVASKAAADLFVEAAIRSHNLNVNIIRPTNVYGGLQHPDKFIPTVIDSLVKGDEIPIFGDVEISRDWLFVEDLCRAIDLVLHDGVRGEIYNVSSGECFKNIELINHIKRKMDCCDIKISSPKEKLGDVSYPTVSSEKIKTELGWKKQESLESGINRTIKWYQDNREWVSEVLSDLMPTLNKKQNTE